MKQTLTRYDWLVAGCVALLTVVVMTTEPAQATPDLMASFSAYYPTSTSDDLAGCQLCHLSSAGGTGWNAYGAALRANGLSFAAVEGLNSDGIGGNNLQEILSGAQPGWCEPTTAGCVNAGTPPLVTLDSFTSIDPDIQVSPSAVLFGIVQPAASKLVDLSVSNGGQNTLIITSATFVQTAGFGTISISSPLPGVIPAGSAAQLTLSFVPNGTTGVNSGTLTIVSNDPDTPTRTIAVSANSQFPLSTYGCSAGNELVDPLPPLSKGGISIRLQKVADGFESPTQSQTAPGHPGRLFVSDQKGTLYAVDLATGAKTVFLNVSSRLVPVGGASGLGYDERGLLGFAFHPGYSRNGLLYT